MCVSECVCACLCVSVCVCVSVRVIVCACLCVSVYVSISGWWVRVSVFVIMSVLGVCVSLSPLPFALSIIHLL